MAYLKINRTSRLLDTLRYHGDNTNFLTCAVDRAMQLSFVQKVAVSRGNRQQYQLGR